MVTTFTAAVIMGGLVLASNARAQVENSWGTLDRVWATVQNKPGTELTLSDFQRLRSSVSDLNTSLGKARRQTLFLRPFTFLSADLETTLDSLTAAQQLTLAANDMLAGLQPAVFFLTEGGQDESVSTQLSSGERTVELLNLGRGRFLSAAGQLAAAQATIDSLDRTRVSPSMLVSIDGLVGYHDLMADINQTLLASPDLLTEALGLEGPKTYLVLSQNNDELRPSGGYISTYGWMVVRNGRIDDYNYSPTTTTSPNPPPVAMSSEVHIPSWWIQYAQPIYAAWDSSWSPDFPTTAQMAAWYYDNGGNPHSPVDGVIGIDVAGFEYILKGLGQVYVPEYDMTISLDNFREAVYEIRADRGENEHKRFVAAIYRQILQDWQSVTQEKNIELRSAMLGALQEKHIMLYFPDPELNDAIRMLGWSGNQEPGTDTDYLMVADANLGNKANRSVSRQITYDVEIMPDGSLTSRAAIAYDYSARVAEEDPAVRPENGDINYRTLTQVFVPVNSTLTSTDNLTTEPTVVNEDTHTDIVTHLRIDYNDSQRFVFSYTTPVLIEQFGPYHRYTLVLQKQPGTYAEPVNVQVTLPKGAGVVSATPAPAASYTLEQRILEFRASLVDDVRIEIIYTD